MSVHEGHRSVCGHIHVCAQDLCMILTSRHHQGLQANSLSRGAGPAGNCLWVFQEAKRGLNGVGGGLLHFPQSPQTSGLSSEPLSAPSPWGYLFPSHPIAWLQGASRTGERGSAWVGFVLPSFPSARAAQ